MTDELLVHISTPATRQTDELYRSLADAYLDFEPQRIYPEVSRQQRLGAPPPTASGVSGSAAPLTGSFLRGIANPSFLSTSKDSYGSFPSYLSSDGHAKGQVETDDDPYQYAPEDDSIPTSSRLARLDQIHQKWREQTTPKSSFVGRKRPAKEISSSPMDADTTFIEDTQLGAQAIQSQLQDSYLSTDEDTSEEESDDGDCARGDVVPSTLHYERGVRSTTAILPPAPSRSILRPSSVIDGRRESSRSIDISSTVVRQTPARSTAAPKPSDAFAKPRESLRSSNVLSTVEMSVPAPSTAAPKSSNVTKERSTVVASASSSATPKLSSIINQRRESLHSNGANTTTLAPIAAGFTTAPKSSGTKTQPRESLCLNADSRALDVSTSTRSMAVPKSSYVGGKSCDSLQTASTSTTLVSTVQRKASSKKSADVIDPTLDGRVAGSDFNFLCVDAFPPEPKISVAQPGGLPSQATKHLAALKAQHPTRFKPSKKGHTPKPDERGYWSIDCSLWSSNQQQEFWTTMCEQITAGRLGWGATLHREAGSSRALGRVRLYCWGEVVEQMWLVLWLCSRANVVGSGLKWYDADGVAVFEMP